MKMTTSTFRGSLYPGARPIVRIVNNPRQSQRTVGTQTRALELLLQTRYFSTAVDSVVSSAPASSSGASSQAGTCKLEQQPRQRISSGGRASSFSCQGLLARFVIRLYIYGNTAESRAKFYQCISYLLKSLYKVKNTQHIVQGDLSRHPQWK